MTTTSIDPAEHGGSVAYENRCKCDECITARRHWKREQRAISNGDNPNNIDHAGLDAGIIYRDLELPGEWRHDRACNGVDPTIFFPERGEAAAPAKAICADCPVRQECLNLAIANNEQFGIWGGMNDRERDHYRRTVLGVILRPRANTLTDAERVEIVELHLAGNRQWEIVEKVGRSQFTVSGVLKAWRAEQNTAA